MRARTAGLFMIAAIVAGRTLVLAGDSGKEEKPEKPRKARYVSLFAQIWKAGESEKGVEAASVAAAEWKLEKVRPAPGSAVESAYAKGASVFQGTFTMTVTVNDGPRPALLLLVGLDPRSDADEDNLDRFLKDLKKRLRKVLSAPVWSKAESRQIH
jgi:hypothetical protein